jgi:hypothetical protein
MEGDDGDVIGVDAMGWDEDMVIKSRTNLVASERLPTPEVDDDGDEEMNTGAKVAAMMSGVAPLKEEDFAQVRKKARRNFATFRLGFGTSLSRSDMSALFLSFSTNMSAWDM